MWSKRKGLRESANLSGRALGAWLAAALLTAVFSGAAPAQVGPRAAAAVNIVGIWDVVDPVTNTVIKQYDLKDDNTYVQTKRIGRNGSQTTPGIYNFRNGILRMRYQHGHNGRIDELEYGRVTPKSDDVLYYKVMGGVLTELKKGKVYELRR
jgi:hypothetical protein